MTEAEPTWRDADPTILAKWLRRNFAAAIMFLLVILVANGTGHPRAQAGLYLIPIIWPAYAWYEWEQMKKKAIAEYKAGLARHAEWLRKRQER